MDPIYLAYAGLASFLISIGMAIAGIEGRLSYARWAKIAMLLGYTPLFLLFAYFAWRYFNA